MQDRNQLQKFGYDLIHIFFNRRIQSIVREIVTDDLASFDHLIQFLVFVFLGQLAKSAFGKLTAK